MRKRLLCTLLTAAMIFTGTNMPVRASENTVVESAQETEFVTESSEDVFEETSSEPVTTEEETESETTSETTEFEASTEELTQEESSTEEISTEEEPELTISANSVSGNDPEVTEVTISFADKSDHFKLSRLSGVYGCKVEIGADSTYKITKSTGTYPAEPMVKISIIADSTDRRNEFLPMLFYEKEEVRKELTAGSQSTSSASYTIPLAEIEDGAIFSLEEKDITTKFTVYDEAEHLTYSRYRIKGNNCTVTQIEEGTYKIIPGKTETNQYITIVINEDTVSYQERNNYYPVLLYQTEETPKEIVPYYSGSSWQYRIERKDIENGSSFILKEEDRTKLSEYKVTFRGENAIVKDVNDEIISGSVMVSNGSEYSFYVEEPEDYTVRSVRIYSGSIGYSKVTLRRTLQKDGRFLYKIMPRRASDTTCPGPVIIDINATPTEEHELTFSLGSGVKLLSVTADGETRPVENNKITVRDKERIAFEAVAENGKGVKCLYEGTTSLETSTLLDRREIKEDGTYRFSLGRNFEDGVITLSSAPMYSVYFDIIDASVYNTTTGEYMENNSCLIPQGQSISFTVDIEPEYKLVLVSTTLDNKGKINPVYDEDSMESVYTVTPTKDTLITVKAAPLERFKISIKEKGNASLDEVYVRLLEKSDSSYNQIGDILLENGECTVLENEGLVGIVPTSPRGEYIYSTMSVNGKAISYNPQAECFLIGAITEDTEVVINTSLKADACRKFVFTAEGESGSYSVQTTEADTDGFIKNPVQSFMPGETYVTASDDITMKIVPAKGYQIEKVTFISADNQEIDQEGILIGEYEYQYLTHYFEMGQQMNVKVQTSVIPSTEKKQISIRNTAEHMTYSVKTDAFVQMAEGKYSIYDVAENCNYFTFTVQAMAGYQPIVTYKEITLLSQTGETSGEKTPYTYKIPSSVFETGTEIVIDELPVSQVITVKYNKEEVALLSARIGSKEVVSVSESNSGSTGIVTYEVPYGQSLVVSVNALTNCKIEKAMLRTDDAAAKKVSVKATGGDIAVKANDDSTVTVFSTALYKENALSDEDDNVIAAVKNTYTVNYGHSYVAGATKGASTSVSFRRGEVLSGLKKAASTVTIDPENRSVARILINEEDAGKKLTVKLYALDGSLAANYTLKVLPVIKGITVSGVKNGVLSQVIDSENSYKIKMNPTSASTEILDVEVDIPDVKASIANGMLKVTTGMDCDKTATVRIYNKDTNEDIQNGTFTVKMTANEPLKKATPTIKLKSSDDISLTLTLGTPKSVKDPVAGKLYYKVSVIPQTVSETENPAEIGNTTKVFYVEKEGLSQDCRLQVVDKEFGNGMAWKYNVKVSLIHMKEEVDFSTLSPEECNNTEKQALAVSKEKEVQNISTIVACVEKNLKLKKGSTNVYTGQSNILIATPQFSKVTTYRSVETATDISFEGTTKLQPYIGEDGNVYVTATENTALGDHIIEVIADDGDIDGVIPAKATIKIKVVQGITSLAVTVPSVRIYKRDKSSGSLKASVVYNSGIDTPKTKKVTWQITDTSGNELDEENPLYKAVTIKNGTVTVNRNYVVSKNSEDNKFRIKAIAADYKGNTTFTVSDVIEITASRIEIGSLVIVKKNEQTSNYDVVGGSNQTVNSDSINGATIVVCRKGMPEKDSYTQEELNTYRIDLNAFSFKSGNKAVSITSDGTITASKAADNVTLTVTANDGGKASAKITKLTIIE
ncbi:MAG: hypothetical protein PUB13_04390 [Lachnospiraceae bacterium]|nr:hypothetical protein [Lachnospiraceae bacterium]